MMIIGCDFHPSWQQVCWLDTETGESGEQMLVQASGDAERFYRQVPAPALIGMEATGNCYWLVDLLAEIGHELHSEAAGGRTVSPYLDAVEPGEGSAAAAVAPLQAGDDSGA